jgi:hypothetical protein
MEYQNLYYAQLGEAISLANSEIFEYKRISLILFDNIVENLLRSKTISELHYLLVMKELDKCDYKNIVNEFDRFNSIINRAKKLEIITMKEAPIVNFCHASRNNLYHKLFLDERITNFCILFYCKFLENYFLKFIETGTISSCNKSQYATKAIKKKEKIKKLDELITKLNIYYSTSKVIPQDILSEILLDLIETIEDFYECYTNENWEELNKIAKNQYFYNYEIKKQHNKGLNYRSLIPKFKQKWYDVNKEKLNDLKKQILENTTLSIELSFEKFKTINQKLEPIYIGIMLYNSEQEYLASLR